jgi:hypothetical protein
MYERKQRTNLSLPFNTLCAAQRRLVSLSLLSLGLWLAALGWIVVTSLPMTSTRWSLVRDVPARAQPWGFPYRTRSRILRTAASVVLGNLQAGGELAQSE